MPSPDGLTESVSVKYLNGEGFIATAFMTKKLIKR
jgi:hypothetical protein